MSIELRHKIYVLRRWRSRYRLSCCLAITRHAGLYLKILAAHTNEKHNGSLPSLFPPFALRARAYERANNWCHASSLHV